MKREMRMESHRDGTKEVPYSNDSLKKVQEFLKDQTPKLTPTQIAPGRTNSLEPKPIRHIEMVRNEAVNTYPPEEKQVEVSKDIPDVKTQPEEKHKDGLLTKVKNFFSRNRNKALLLTGLLTIGATAQAENINGIGHSTENVNSGGDEGGRKVKEVPPGYVKSHTDGKKTYYKKVSGGSSGELKPAKPGDGKGSARYEKWLKDLLKKGEHSPEKLAELGYISDEAIEEYRKYYTPPTVDIVYTEPEENKEADPFSAYAKYGESLWGTNKHLIGFLCTEVRNTQSITENGNLNTSKPEHKVLIRMVDKMGKETGECIETTMSKIQDVFGTGTEVKNPELLEEWRAKAKIELAKKKATTHIATAEDFAQNK